MAFPRDFGPDLSYFGLISNLIFTYVMLSSWTGCFVSGLEHHKSNAMTDRADELVFARPRDLRSQIERLLGMDGKDPALREERGCARSAFSMQATRHGSLRLFGGHTWTLGGVFVRVSWGAAAITSL